MLGETSVLAIVATSASLPTVIDRSRWPIHVTVAGNFSAPRGCAVVPAILRDAAAIPGFAVHLGPAATFGINEDIPVLLAEHPSLRHMHDALAGGLRAIPGLAVRDPDYWGDGYRPHATLGTEVDAVVGETLQVRVVTLVSLEGACATPIYSVDLR